VDADTILAVALVAVLLLGAGSLLVAWRAAAAADRARVDAARSRDRLWRVGADLSAARAELAAIHYARSGPRRATATPDATREMHIVRDAT